jgi:RimJ/RimL family protein N-acetyltransferase
MDITIRRATHPDEVRYIYEGLVENPGATLLPVELLSLAQLMDDAQRSIYWMILADGEVVGNAGLMGIDWVQRAAEYAIVIRDPKHRRKGVAGRVTKKVAAKAFDELGLERVFARPGAYNEASIALLERVGWGHEGTIRRARYHEGQWWNQELYSTVKGG